MPTHNGYRQSKSSIFTLFGFLLLFVSMGVASAPYVPPTGIPEPEFGINETVESVYG